MPPPFNNPHWNHFARIPHRAAGPVGYAPSAWAIAHGLTNVPTGEIPLPTAQLDRVSVRSICRDPANPVLFGYICAMAWGLQGVGPGGPGHVARAWANRFVLTPKLTARRAGGLTRCQAYDLFTGSNSVPGLGPAYFTKLLYFFSPTSDFYILDQHTGKSVNLLTGTRIVRMTGNAVSNLNRCGNYQAYCEEVDAMARLLGVTGEQAEEMMMSKGGRDPWPWRAHVRANWPKNAPTGRYGRAAIHATYRHISLNCF